MLALTWSFREVNNILDLIYTTGWRTGPCLVGLYEKNIQTQGAAWQPSMDKSNMAENLEKQTASRPEPLNDTKPTNIFEFL